MPTNEEGEFELVLGNKHLLSVFFVVVLMLGVFFMMGYVIGRNLSPGEEVAAADLPIEVEPASGVSSPVSAPAPDRPTPMPEEPATVSQATPAPPIQATPPPPAPVKPAPVQTAPPKPAPPPAAVPKPPAPKPAAPAPAAAGSGTFLQVVATTADGAARVSQELTQRGFRIATQPVPDSPLVRVLVGPLDGVALANAQRDLQSLGYNPFVRRM